MNIKKILLVLALVVTAFFAQGMRADAAKTVIPVSPALQIVLDQAGKIVVKTAQDWKNFLSNEPDMAAVFIGLIMQRQHILMQQYRNPDDITRFLSLNNEVEQFLSHLAKILNYRLPEDGSNLPPEKLHGLYRQARNGNMNAMIMKESGFDPTTANVPFMIRQVPLSTQTGDGGNLGDGVRAKLQMKKKNEIDLLGKGEVAANTNHNRTPTLKIISLTLDPDPVPVNTAFDFKIKFKIDLPGAENNKLPTNFYFKIYKNKKKLFTSKDISFDSFNGKTKSWKQHMEPVRKAGVYKIITFVKYKELFDKKSITLTIK